ncbi:right-handed parallel beta-helix repeat-containing protein [Candidatus Bathyarchaeota archaeon]|nr:right-handed parallel beta-helix repeat-containing protein [Candidatus Bathyarchaeota archaeon]
MFKRKKPPLILFLLIMSTLTFNIQPVKSEPKTWTVDDDGPADFHTIQDAINAADLGDTIFVKAGTYLEHVEINKTASLVGENPANTILDGEGTIIPIVRIIAPNVTFCNFTVRNTASDWETYGIYVRNTQRVRIINNIVKQTYSGILLENASYCKVFNNTLLNNYAWGIYLRLEGSNNNMIGNSVVGNPTGVYIADSSCQNNTFYHNNFVENQNQISTFGIHTSWDNGAEGNYWSDYTGVDFYGGPYQNETGSDGIGDTPYVINADNQDKYPLMEPWSPIMLVGDVNHDGVVNINDIVLIASIYGCEEGEPYWNPEADLAPPYGKIDIYDLVTCVYHYGQTRK